MKESLYSIWKAPIFKEGFNNSFDVNDNQGTPNAVTFSNGVASFVGATHSTINYPLPKNGVYSVRVKVKPTTTVSQYLCDFRVNSGTGYLYIDGSNQVASSSGNIYVDGVAAITPIANQWNDIVVTGITLNYTNLRVGASYSANSDPLTGDIELIEIYDYALTANEVLNLYQNKRYVNTLMTSEILNVDARNGAIMNKYSGSIIGSNLVVNGTFTTWTGTFPNEVPTGWTVGGTQNATNYLTPSSGGLQLVSDGTLISLYQNILVVGKTYRISFDVISTTNNAWEFGVGSTQITADAVNGSVAGPKMIDVLCAGSASFTFKRSSATNVVIDNLTLTEIVPNLVNTAVVASKVGSVYAMEFNNSTSKIDCGRYDDLVGDKTFIAWIYMKQGSSTYTAPRLFNNNKIMIYRSYYLPSAMEITSDGSTFKSSATAITDSTWQMWVITRSSAGIVNFYLNAVVSGTANQNSGIPGVSTTNLYIGADGGDHFQKGYMNGMRIINGLLTTQQIQQLFDSERKFYNV